MTETVTQAVDTPASDANANPEVSEADADAKPTGSEADSSPAVKDPDDSKQALKGVGKRIDELTRNWREAERREQALLRLLEQDRAEAKQPPPEPEKPKSLADFEYDEGKFLAHQREQLRKDAVEAAKQELKAERDRTDAARRLTEFRAREAKFAALTPDYAEVAHFAPVSDSVAGMVTELDEGPAVAYYLGKNPEVARKLNELPERTAAIELGRIEARLVAERAKAKSKPVSEAPAPAPTLTPSDAKVDKDPREMTDAEFDKWRRKFSSQRR